MVSSGLIKFHQVFDTSIILYLHKNLIKRNTKDSILTISEVELPNPLFLGLAEFNAVYMASGRMKLILIWRLYPPQMQLRKPFGTLSLFKVQISEKFLSSISLDPR